MQWPKFNLGHLTFGAGYGILIILYLYMQIMKYSKKLPNDTFFDIELKCAISQPDSTYS